MSAREHCRAGREATQRQTRVTAASGACLDCLWSYLPDWCSPCLSWPWPSDTSAHHVQDEATAAKQAEIDRLKRRQVKVPLGSKFLPCVLLPQGDLSCLSLHAPSQQSRDHGACTAPGRRSWKTGLPAVKPACERQRSCMAPPAASDSRARQSPFRSAAVQARPWQHCCNRTIMLPAANLRLPAKSCGASAQ